MTPVTRTTARAAALVGLAGIAGLSLASCAAGSATGGSDVSYADGSYSADGDYVAPSGPESITVELTIEDDTVTAVTVTPHATEWHARERASRRSSPTTSPTRSSA